MVNNIAEQLIQRREINRAGTWERYQDYAKRLAAGEKLDSGHMMYLSGACELLERTPQQFQSDVEVYRRHTMLLADLGDHESKAEKLENDITKAVKSLKAAQEKEREAERELVARQQARMIHGNTRQAIIRLEAENRRLFNVDEDES